MILSTIQLTHFRNFERSQFTFSPHLTLIIGENARGKTSLLEGVYVSVYGTGFRESREEELVQWEADDSIVDAVFLDDTVKTRFQVRMQRIGENRVKKSYYVNKTAKSSFQYRKLQMQAVLFAPEHIHIITGSPGRRRRYFDEVISAVDAEYKKKLRNYEHALRRRNKVLEQYTDERQLDEELRFWNGYLIEHASYITGKRSEYSAYLNAHPRVDGKSFSIRYLADPFSPERLEKVYRKEKLYRRTVIGPQKDDYEIYLDSGHNKNVSLFGSRSEQRMGIFWLKLNELQFFEQASHHKPILLLDDIFSELDGHNRQLVMHVIKNHQTIATTTEEEIGELAEMPEEIIRL